MTVAFTKKESGKNKYPTPKETEQYQHSLSHINLLPRFLKFNYITINT